MILFSFLSFSLQRVAITEFENRSNEELTQNISSFHQNIATELQTAISNITSEEYKMKLEEILEKHNSYSIESIFGETNASYNIMELYSHLDRLKEIVDETRGYLEKQDKTTKKKNIKDAEENLKACISYIGQEYSVLQYYEQNTDSV